MPAPNAEGIGQSWLPLAGWRYMRGCVFIANQLISHTTFCFATVCLPLKSSNVPPGMGIHICRYIHHLRIILTTMADLCRSYALLGVPYSCLNSSLGGWGIQRNTWVPFSREMSLAYVAAQCHCCFESSALKIYWIYFHELVSVFRVPWRPCHSTWLTLLCSDAPAPAPILHPLHLSLVFQFTGGMAFAYAAWCLTNRTIKCNDRTKAGHSANVNQKQLTGFKKSWRKALVTREKDLRWWIVMPGLFWPLFA